MSSARGRTLAHRIVSCLVRHRRHVTWPRSGRIYQLSTPNSRFGGRGQSPTYITPSLAAVRGEFLWRRLTYPSESWEYPSVILWVVAHECKAPNDRVQYRGDPVCDEIQRVVVIKHRMDFLKCSIYFLKCSLDR